MGINYDEFAKKLDKHGLLNTTVLACYTSIEIADLTIKLMIDGLVLKPTDLTDEMPPFCKIIKCGGTNADWYYIIPAEHI